MELTIHIQATELANAIQALAIAIEGGAHKNNQEFNAASAIPVQAPQLQTVQSQPVAQARVIPLQQPQQPVQQQQQFQPLPTATAVPTSAPQPQPIQQQVPQQQTAVPTSAPTYTIDQLAVASTQLMDAGKQPQLLQLLAAFGVQALMQLPKDQYGAFATKLRELGANL